MDHDRDPFVDFSYRQIGPDVERILEFIQKRVSAHAVKTDFTHEEGFPEYKKLEEGHENLKHIISKYRSLTPNVQKEHETIKAHYRELYEVLSGIWPDVRRAMDQKEKSATTAKNALKRWEENTKDSYQITILEVEALKFRYDRVMSALSYYDQEKFT